MNYQFNVLRNHVNNRVSIIVFCFPNLGTLCDDELKIGVWKKQPPKINASKNTYLTIFAKQSTKNAANEIKVTEVRR